MGMFTGSASFLRMWFCLLVSMPTELERLRFAVRLAQRSTAQRRIRSVLSLVARVQRATIAAWGEWAMAEIRKLAVEKLYLRIWHDVQKDVRALEMRRRTLEPAVTPKCKRVDARNVVPSFG